MTRKRQPRKRPYHAPQRAAAAAETRHAILQAARRLLVERGYAHMTMERVAKEAGVALDTVYAAAGKKPTLVKLLVETAISGGDEPVEAEQRAYVQRIRATPGAAAKLALYAEAVAEISPRLGPLVRALRDAAPGHRELERLWREIAERRRRNMSLLAAELRATGELRPELPREEVADVLWALAAPEVYTLFIDERGWPAARFARWLADSWTRLLLVAPPR